MCWLLQVCINAQKLDFSYAASSLYPWQKRRDGHEWRMRSGEYLKQQEESLNDTFWKYGEVFSFFNDQFPIKGNYASKDLLYIQNKCKFYQQAAAPPNSSLGR